MIPISVLKMKNFPSHWTENQTFLVRAKNKMTRVTKSVRESLNLSKRLAECIDEFVFEVNKIEDCNNLNFYQNRPYTLAVRFKAFHQ